MPNLYIIATPIGNLEDISLRALRTLKEVDIILCEDTRVTQKLLSRYQIETKTLSYHQHSKLTRLDQIFNLLKQGKDLALVSDAGTPGISDAGNKLVAEALKLVPEIKVSTIPGPSALTALASVAGFSLDRFLFLGFPPVKKRRKRFFQEVLSSKYPVIFYESRYRIIKTLTELETGAKIQNLDLLIVVGRELTKKFETIYRGKISEVINQINNDKIKGEFAIIVNK